ASRSPALTCSPKRRSHASGEVADVVIAQPARPLTLPSPPRGEGRERVRLLEDREVDLFLGDELEEHRDAVAGLGDAALEGGDDLARLGDALAVAAEGLRHVRVVAADVGGAVLLG